MNSKAKIILGLVFLALFSTNVAATNNVVKKESGEYFYSIPNEAGTEWAYQIPMCAQMNKDQKEKILKCEKKSDRTTCTAKEIVTLKNVLTNKTQSFKILFHVFSKKEDCVGDRESLLSEEG